MKRTLSALFALSCAIAHAEVYRCPPTYPGNDAPAYPVSGAFMMWGQRPSSGPPFPSGWDTPNERAVEEGRDLEYELPEHEEGWLICEYGARKRIKGQFKGGKEFGQRMEALGEEPWFVKLAPRDTRCTVRIREQKSGKSSTWTVTATCGR